MTMKESRRVVVTGLGLITPLGCGMQHVWKALLQGHCGIVKLAESRFSKLPCQVAGIVPRGSASHTFDPSRYVTPSEQRTMSLASLFALAATEEAMQDSGIPREPSLLKRTGVAIGMGMADLDYIAETSKMLETSPNRVSPYFIPRILTNMGAGLISIRYGLQGPNHSVSTACATGAHSIGDAANFIRYGAADAMICGGTEAGVVPIALAGFSRLRALSTDFNDKPEQASRPFDVRRNGFVMGEGAGILVLEELEQAKARKAKIYAEIAGYGLSGDANHITAPSADGRGALAAMCMALENADLLPEQVSYVNAHATSTPLGDLIEAQAVERVFGPQVHVSSHKGNLGHLQGAAGAVEAALTVQAVSEAVIPHTINVQKPDPNIKVHLVTQRPLVWKNEPRIALKNSFGFGGTNASLCVKQFVSP